MQIALFVLGVALCVTGLAFIYWPLALIAPGLLLTVIAVRADFSKQPISEPDNNI